MTEEELLHQLETLVERLGFQLRYEKGNFKGGGCRVGEEKLMILNNKLLPMQKIQILASELAQFELNDQFILPEVRELIDNNKNDE